MKNNISIKDLQITYTPDSVILSNGHTSVELLVFTPQQTAHLQKIADRIYAEKATMRNKLTAKKKQK